jgi:hypothetical protein
MAGFYSVLDRMAPSQIAKKHERVGAAEVALERLDSLSIRLVRDARRRSAPAVSTPVKAKITTFAKFFIAAPFDNTRMSRGRR